MNRLEQNDIRTPSYENPLRILTSGCLYGLNCGYDGTSYGSHNHLKEIFNSQLTKIFHFCPEDYAFGTPRPICDIHDGDGYDVLDGQAKVLTSTGEDWTERMLKAANEMLELALSNMVELAILMDISAACGTQVIYRGGRLSSLKEYQKGPGVCSALLDRNGIRTISQRDFASLEIVKSKIINGYQLDKTAIDHHQTEWYKNYFKSKRS